MSKISDLSDGGSLQSTDFLVAVRSGGNVKVQADAVKVDTLSVGTTTNNETLVVGSSDSGSNFVQITNATTTAADNRGFYVGIDANEAARVLNRENTAMFFSTNNVTQMTLDASGNLLVGKTSAGGYSTAGIELRGGSDDYATITKDGGTTLYLNRLTSDGDIVSFRKDGTEVGSIGSYSNSYLYIGSEGGTDTHIAFVNGSVRASTNDGSLLDNVLNLGNASARWKDLYLGGGVYLGGTGAANKLDDYEEGTWTPIFAAASGAAIFNQSPNVNMARYTKIGDTVTAAFYITYPSTLTTTASYSASAGLQLAGLPFLSNRSGSNDFYASIVSWYDNFTGYSGGTPMIYTNQNQTRCTLVHANGNNISVILQSNVNNGGSAMLAQLIYKTTA